MDRKEYMRKWYALHPEYQKEKAAKARERYASDPSFRVAKSISSREWRKNNKERERATGNAWRAANLDLARATQRRFYLRHKAERVAAAAAARARDPEKARKIVKNYRVRRPASCLLSVAKSRAKLRNHEFNLTLEWMQKRLLAGCALTGYAFDMSAPSGKGTTKPRAPSVDRIDSTKGYTQENSRLICWALNTAMGTWGWAETAPLMRAALEREDEHCGRSLNCETEEQRPRLFLA